MKLKVKNKWLTELTKKHPNEKVLRLVRYSNAEDVQLVDTAILLPTELLALNAIAKADSTDKLSSALQGRIAMYQRLSTSVEGEAIKTLPAFETALRNYLAKLPNRWLFEDSEDGFMLPYVAVKVQYYPRDRRNDSPAHVELRLEYAQRGERKSDRRSWHRSDLRGCLTVEELLSRAGLIPEKPFLLKSYEADMVRYLSHHAQTGAQFSAAGVAYPDSYYSGRTRAMVEDGVPSKVVMDDMIKGGGEENEQRPTTAHLVNSLVLADASGNNVDEDDEEDLENEDEEVESKAPVVDFRYVPVHPYVLVFRLEDHSFYQMHIGNLQPYAWDTSVIEKLVLSEEKKDLVNLLVTSAGEVLEDIVAGKTGGVIVAASGPPGTGKTLTAEVYCETTKSPLYTVQCSQLGTDEEAVENKLKLVLQRAMRWRAILLIDEADVYVRERGTDIQQNAIVGVFLRTLERYRGILFLTTNRATSIDDAILSRLTAHLRYELPTPEELARIWKVLAANYKVVLPDKVIAELVKQLPHISGRSVKNMLKLAGVVLRKEGKQADAALFVRLSRFQDIEQATKGKE